MLLCILYFYKMKRVMRHLMASCSNMNVILLNTHQTTSVPMQLHEVLHPGQHPVYYSHGGCLPLHGYQIHSKIPTMLYETNMQEIHAIYM